MARYYSPLKEKLHKFKFNPVYPSFRQIKRDAFWTSTAMLAAAALEIGLCHLWATGAVAFQEDMWETPLSNLLWIVTITHWRIPHFWVIHRSMHPWKTTSIPDLGKLLYRHIHALHHKSYNPTAFSGTNMHPVESTLYFSAALIAVPFGCHPTIVVGCIVDCAVGAWLGHDGFQWPGSGDYFHQVGRFARSLFRAPRCSVCHVVPRTTLFRAQRCSTWRWSRAHSPRRRDAASAGSVHPRRFSPWCTRFARALGQLHHAHFDCNYGAMHVPIDKWLGTFAGGKEDVRKIWGRLNDEDANKEK